MPTTPIPFPLSGISDSFSYEDQPPGTSVEAVNVRAVDPVTGRVRGAQREGLAKLSTSRVSANGKVQAIASVTYDGRSTTYTNASSSTPGDLTEWDEVLNELQVVVVDVQGDVWTVDGNALLLKYNGSGVKQFEFPLPVAASNHIVRTLTVDDFGNVYVAVSEGTTRPEDAWIRSYYPSAEKNLELRWQVKPGGFTEKLHLLGDKLYAGVNFPGTGRARVIAYENISSAVPDEAQSWSVPYPINDLDLNASGEVVTAHEPKADRSYDPSVADCTHILDEQRWDPTKLEDWDKRKWAWFSAGAIPFQLGSEDIQNGDDIVDWRDISGRGTCLLKPDPSSASYLTPKYVTGSLGGRPAVRFDGAGYRLVSEPSLGTGASQNDAQPTLVPGTNGYLVVMVVKASSDYTTPGALFYQDCENNPNMDEWDDGFHGYDSASSDQSTAYQRMDHCITLNGKPGRVLTVTTTDVVWYNPPADPQGLLVAPDFLRLYVGDLVHVNTTDSSELTNNTDYYIVSKRTAGSAGYGIELATTPGGTPIQIVSGTAAGTEVEFADNGQITADPGYVGAFGINDMNTYPTGDLSKPVESYGRFDNAAGGAIISYLMDCGDCDASFSFSQFRVNGVPLAQWEGFRKSKTAAGYRTVIGKLVNSDASSTLGVMLNAGACAGLGADVCEIFIIRRYTDAAGVNKICTFPNYNANAEDADNPPFDPTSDTELERIEGYFAWKYGISHLLDAGGGAADSAPTWDGTTKIGESEYAHPFVNTEAPPNPNGRDSDNWDHLLWTEEVGILAKWSPQRGIRWVTLGGTSGVDAGGVGYGVVTDSDDIVFSVGPKGDSTKTVKAFQDGGGTVAEVAAYANTNTSGQAAEYGYAHPRLAVDQFDNLWVPANWTSELQATSVRAFAYDGTTSLSRLIGYKLTAQSVGTQKARAVALDLTERDYTDNPNTISYPESLVLATDDGGVAGAATLHYIDLVEAEANNAAPRNIVWVAAAGGDIKTFTGGTVAAVTNGTAALDLNSPYVAAVQAFSKVYFTDGQVYKVYDPKLNTVSEWTSETSGKIPERCRLMSFWRGRMVLARGPDDPFNWHMSALGNPNDWNQFPPDSPLATQAISGNNSEVGGNHDIINSLIPYDRERLIFGGDHTIHMMWGDPMEGGSIALLSDVTGIAFGSGYTKDSSGILYFYGSRGGIYAMAPGGQSERISNQPVKISSETIDRKLNTVNLSTHYIGLVWDDIEQMLHVYQLPFNQGGTIVDHWCWEKKTGAWWVDRFSATGVQPTALAVLDGDDPDDRVIAIGCEDGYVRYPSRSSTTDDGYVIDSYVTIGPFYTAESALRVRNPKVTLARDQGGCWLEMFSSDTPDVVGDPVQRMFLNPGQNPKSMVGVRGPYAWLRLRSAAVGQRWAYESGQIEVYTSGRKVAP